MSKAKAPPADTEPPKRIDVIVLRSIGGEDGNMIHPSDTPVSLPAAVAKKLQQAGAVEVFIDV